MCRSGREKDLTQISPGSIVDRIRYGGADGGGGGAHGGGGGVRRRCEEEV